MGWTYYCATEFKNGKIDRLAECRKEFGKNHDWATIIKDAMVGTTYYAAMKLTKTNEVFALIVLTAVDKTDFGYKDMDETMQPFYYDCPANILDLLSPTKNELALEWRKNCRRNIANKKELSNAKKIRITLPANYNGTYYSANDVIDLSRYSKSVWADISRGIGFKQSDVLRFGFTILD